MSRHLVTRRELWSRILFALGLVTVAYVIPMMGTLREAAAGSFTAYTVVVPLLIALIAAGHTRPPSGVSDAETDWIVAALLGGGGFLVLTLAITRLPTLAGLWRVENLFPALWGASAAMVLFSVRYVLRVWGAWLFAMATAPVLNYFLLTAALGGRDDDAVLVSAMLGTIAVGLSARVAPRLWRLIATGLNLVIALALCQLTGSLIDSLLVRVVIVGGLLPLLSVLVLHQSVHITDRQRFNSRETSFPHRRVWSYPTLVFIALVLLWNTFQLPSPPAPPTAHADWAAKMGLHATGQFPFISRFVGPGSTLTRYRLPDSDGRAGLAIDVISTPNRARLDDYSDAVWYPSTAPANYRPIDLSAPVVARSLASGGAGITSSDASPEWYLVTWNWAVPGGHQQVSVIMDRRVSPTEPPSPRALTWGNSLVDPLIWLIRQQPDPSDLVPRQTADTVGAVARQILAAGAPR